MRLCASEITAAVSRLVQEANQSLPPDVLRALRAGFEREAPGSVARSVFTILEENARLAGATGRPICQDTGIDAVFVTLGAEEALEGDLEAAIHAGVAQGTREGFLRSSVCDPLTRKNTGDNTPAVVHVEVRPGRGLEITVLPKGCGSENMSGLFMLPPSAGLEGIIRAVVDRVRSAGPNPCPPGVIGVGLGGTMEKAALLSKKALLRPVGARHPREDVAALEEAISAEISRMGLGPLGLGGTTSCLGVAVEIYPCHIASLPVAVNIQCHAARRRTAVRSEAGWAFSFGPEPEGLETAPPAPGKAPEAASARRVDLPLSPEAARGLRAGEWVLLNGPLYTGRDQTHRRLVELLEAGSPLPVDLKGQLIYYVGPSPAPPGRLIGSAGPTTSYRMDAYTPRLLEQGVAATLGKGRRSAAVREALKAHGAVYLATIGGAGAYLAERITACEVVAFPELGPEALYRMEVRDLPAIVINDAAGGDAYDEVAARAGG